jgi:amino acid adenylation domain-containing protein
MISSIPYMLRKTLGKYSDKEAIVHGTASITFAEYHDHSLATAHALIDLGIKKGDRVGICMNKSIDQAIAILAVMYANAVFVPILPKLKDENIKHIVNNSGMAAMITDASRIREVSGYGDAIKLIIGAGDGDQDFPCLPVLRNQINYNTETYDSIGSDNAAIIYSSGSTGRPKGIVLSHRNLYDGTRIVARYLNTTSEDRIAGILSFNFDYGLNQLWQTIYKGCSLYLHDLVFPNDFFDMLSVNRITALPLMPVIISKLYDPRFYIPNSTHDYSNLRYICSSGGRVSETMINNLSASFQNTDIVLMYGLTEAFRSTYLPPEQLKYRPTSIGKGIPDAKIYVLNDTQNDCPPGVQGELVHRGGCISKGYWNNDSATKKVFREIDRFPGEKVVFSGDIVEMDEDGYLYFVARSDAMIKTYGYRVSPTEIESEAVKHEMIDEAVVFGVINPEIGEDVVLVYTTTDRKPLNEKLLLHFLKDGLPRYMVPRFLLHHEEFPSTGNEGKVNRVNIIRQATEQMGLST